MLRTAALALLLALPARAEDAPAPTEAAATEAAPSATAAAESMLTDAVRLLAAGKLHEFMDRHCGDCETKSARDRWLRYQLSTATQNAAYCLHGEDPGQVEVTRWQGDLAADGRAKAYLRCGGGQHAAQQEARLPPPVTVERRGEGVYKITQLSI
jgi:hypothetical protein